MKNNNTDINITNFEEEISDKDEPIIITNNDEFCNTNDLQTSTSKNTKTTPNIINQITHQNPPKKLNEPYKISSPMGGFNTPRMNLYSLLINGDGESNTMKNKKITKKKMIYKKKSKKNTKNINNNNVQKYLDALRKKGKSVFIKISEDIYTKFKSKPNKEVRDIYKTEEDAYNKMTSDPYIQTCENKENNKNKKIVQQCLDRKAKEDIFKKIGIECDRNRVKKKLHDPKRAFSVTDRNNNLKSTRTLSQFLRDQNGERKKEKKNKNNKKIPLPIKGNILPQDSTFIFSENKNENSDLSSRYSKLSDNYLEYEDDYKSMIPKNEKFKINTEEEKDFINNDINHKINKTFEMDKDIITKNNFSLIEDNKNKKFNNNYNKKKKILIGRDKNIKTKSKINNINNNIKDTSDTSKSKDNTDFMINKYLEIYREIIELNFNQKIENDFEINYIGFLLLLFKTGFTIKNYSSLMETSYDIDYKKKDNNLHSSELSDISIPDSSLSIGSQNKINKNFEIKYNKNSISGKSLEDEGEKYINNFKNEKEFQLSQDAWKILTEKKKFDEDASISSKIFFLFYISVLGIGGHLRIKKIYKKEYNFFFNDKIIMTKYNNMNKYINKYFGVYAMNAQDNALISEKNTLIMKSNVDSIISSFSVNNSEISNKKYDIYRKNYYKNNQNNNLEEGNSLQLFKDEIKNEEPFFYSVHSQSDKSSKSLMTLTDINHMENNNNNNLVNSFMTDTSSILDLKKMLASSDNLRSELDGEEISDDLDVNSFLSDEDIKDDFQSINKDQNENEKIEKNKNNKDSNNNNTKKRVGYAFEIKVENEMKKLILKNGEDKDKAVLNFCKKYNINEKEKTKIIKIIDERLSKLNN